MVKLLNVVCNMSVNERKYVVVRCKSPERTIIVVTCDLRKRVDYPRVSVTTHQDFARILVDYAKGTGRTELGGKDARGLYHNV